MPPPDSNAGGGSPNLDTEVGRVVVDMGLATKGEIDFCREQQKQASDPNQRSLTDLLVEHSFITVNQARRIRRQIEDRKKNTEVPGYELITKVGKGAMATVFKGRQISLDRIVAIKVLPRKMSESADFVDRFYKEGKAAARLSHNNIVQAIDVGCSPNGYHYFVMEFIEGDTLYDWMARPPEGKGKVFSEAEALDVILQIADALEHAHERGLIHRDVKPKNIILRENGVAKLTDLGLARATDDHEAAESEAGKAYGTPYYISPEQIRGDVDIDFRADIYSLGATLYHLVTGRPPFEGDTPTAVMHKHLKQPLVPADHINTSLSTGIGEIIDVAMAKKREERYQSTRDMVEDLKAVRAGQPPTYARRQVDLESLAQMEEQAGQDGEDGSEGGGGGRSGQTVDIAPPRPRVAIPWTQPALLVLLSVVALSIVANVVLVIVLLMR